MDTPSKPLESKGDFWVTAPCKGGLTNQYFVRLEVTASGSY
jgi:hypothetical protein